MAGSLKGFKYTADDDTTWALFADESNIESVNTGVLMAITPAEKYKVPKNLKPRTATFQNADGTIRRKVVVLTTDRMAELDAATTITDQVSGDTLQLKRTDGEVVTLVSLSDTGLLDGDAD
jgi:hypothetical protein